MDAKVSDDVVAAETAVKAYEDAPLTTLVQVTAAEELGKAAQAKVDLVTNADKKAAFQARIDAQKAKVDAAKAELSVLKVNSVTALNSKTIEIKVNNALKKSSAESTTGYTVTKVLNNPGITVVGAVLSADGKTITLTLDKDLISSSKGYVLNIAKDKLETVDGVKNAETEVVFDGNGAVDNVKPAVARAEYDAANNKLTLKFNKLVSTTDSEVDESKVTLVGSGDNQSVTLTEDAFAGSGTSGDSITLKVPAAVAAFTQPVKVQIGAQFVQDLSATPLVNDTQEISATVATKAAAQSATYDEQTNKLVVTFNKTVDVSEIDLTKVKVKLNNGTATTVGGKVLTTTDSNVVEIEAGFIEPATVSAAALVLDAGAVKDVDGVANEAQTSVSLTYTDDVTKPTLVSASYNDLADELTLVFSEKIKVDNTDTDFDKSKITIGGVAVAAVKTPAGSKDTVVVTPGATKPSATNKINIADGAVKDDSGNTIAKVENIVATITDLTKPTWVTFDDDADVETAPTSTQVKITFSEKVKKEQAENVANYKIYASANDSVLLPVTKATLDVDGKTVYLTTGTQSGLEYTVEVSNIQDLAGNVVTETATPADQKFNGAVGTADTTGPVTANASDELVVVDNDESGTITKGDQLVLKFDEPTSIDFSKVTAADFYVTDSSDTEKDSAAAFGTGAKFEYGDDTTELVITLGTLGTGKITLGDKVDVAVNNDILDLAGNKATQSATADREVVTKPTDAPYLESIVYSDADEDGAIGAGDKVKFTFTQAVNIADNTALYSFIEDTVQADFGSDIADVDGSATGLTNVTEFEVTLAGTVASTLIGTQVTGEAAAGITNAWGNALAALTDAIEVTSADTTAPSLLQVKVDKGSNTGTVLEAGDKIQLIFSEAVNEQSAKDNRGKFYLKSNGVQIGFAGAATEVAHGSDAKTVEITVASGDGFEGVSLEGLYFNFINSNAFVDASGNKAVAGADIAVTE